MSRSGWFEGNRFPEGFDNCRTPLPRVRGKDRRARDSGGEARRGFGSNEGHGCDDGLGSNQGNGSDQGLGSNGFMIARPSNIAPTVSDAPIQVASFDSRDGYGSGGGVGSGGGFGSGDGFSVAQPGSCEAISSDTPARALPAGRYRLFSERLVVELRVDIEELGIVSADVFVQYAEPHYLLSLRSQPSLEVNGIESVIPVMIEDRDGAGCSGRLQLVARAQRHVIFDLQVHDGTDRLPAGSQLLAVGGWIDGFFRTLSLEVETEQGAAALPLVTVDSRDHTVTSCYANAGIEVIGGGARSDIATPEGAWWSDAALHRVMVEQAQQDVTQLGWRMQMLMLKRSATNGLLGVMFDSGEFDSNQLPRQGLAVFSDEIREARPNDWQRKLLQTSVHEIGHALNLVHRFEPAVGRADSHSFMNYDWHHPSGPDQFWEGFEFRFDSDELVFLRHAPLHSIVPGAAGFHSVRYWGQTGPYGSPFNIDRPSTEFRLTIEGGGEDFGYAQPIYLTVRLWNHSGVPQKLPKHLLDVKAGLLSFRVQRMQPNGL